jgi:hypothetical protein
MENQHYSTRLKGEVSSLKEHILDIDIELLDFLIYLASDKFAGVENNFVNASEVYNRIQKIRQSLNKVL